MNFKNELTQGSQITEGQAARLTAKPVSEVSFPGGIYQVTSSFRVGMGSWRISCKINDLLRFSNPDYEAEGFGSGIITNKI